MPQLTIANERDDARRSEPEKDDPMRLKTDAHRTAVAIAATTTLLASLAGCSSPNVATVSCGPGTVEQNGICVLADSGVEDSSGADVVVDSTVPPETAVEDSDASADSTDDSSIVDSIATDSADDVADSASEASDDAADVGDTASPPTDSVADSTNDAADTSADATDSASADSATDSADSASGDAADGDGGALLPDEPCPTYPYLIWGNCSDSCGGMNVECGAATCKPTGGNYDYFAPSNLPFSFRLPSRPGLSNCAPCAAGMQTPAYSVWLIEETTGWAFGGVRVRVKPPWYVVEAPKDGTACHALPLPTTLCRYIPVNTNFLIFTDDPNAPAANAEFWDVSGPTAECP